MEESTFKVVTRDDLIKSLGDMMSDGDFTLAYHIIYALAKNWKSHDAFSHGAFPDRVFIPEKLDYLPLFKR